MLDDIISDPDTVVADSISSLDTKRLIDVKAILTESGLTEAVKNVELDPHPRLWKIISEFALVSLDLNVAQKAFVQSNDYQGLQFVKRLKKIEDRDKQKAEVSSQLSDFDMSEKNYLEMDRKDLAIDLRVRLGDWFRVIQLIKSGGGTSSADDILLEKIRKNIGDYYYDRQRWFKFLT